MGSKLISKNVLQEQQYELLQHLTEKALKMVKAAK
jgi:hypothetical protein